MNDPVKSHWIVTKAQKASTPTSDLKRHDDFEEARKEAERLAAKENKVFYVYKLAGVAQPVNHPIEWTEPA